MALFILPSQPALTLAGLPAVGAQLFFYISGTLTLADVYTTSAKTTAHANPVVANGAGRFPSVYTSDGMSYRLIIKDALGVTLGDVDPYLLAADGTSPGVTHVDALGSPAYLKTVSDIINGLPVNMFRFVSQAKIAGIRARTDTSDLTADFATAMAAGAAEIILDPGLYNTTGAIAMSAIGKSLRGAGSNRSEIKIASTTASAITLANGVAGYNVSGLKVTRTGVPGVNAHGVQCLGTTDKSSVEGLVLEDHYTNLVLGTCDTGSVRNIESRRAYQYGVFQTCAPIYGASQWDVDSVLVEKNAVDGWRAESTAGTPGMIFGSMNNFRSFANGGRGLHVIGTVGTPVFDLRLSNAFCGDDALGSVRLHTFGGKHRLQGFFERSSRGLTGRTYSTAATNTANNIEITANNTDAMIYGSTIDEAGYNGILHQGGILMVTGNMIYNNGQGLVLAQRNGILSEGGRLIASGNEITNIGGAAQAYAIASNHGNVRITGNGLDGNTIQPMTIAAITTQTVVFGNTPDTQLSYMPGTIDKLKFNSMWSATATGGDQGAGTINVAGGLIKNGVAYTHP